MISYYTDGSCWPNPGHGAFAVVRDGKDYMVGTEEGISTNIRMEALAIIAALEDSDGNPCTIYTDSQYWVDVITKWGKGWRDNGWKRKRGVVANLDLVKICVDLFDHSDAKLVWVRGHAGDKGNVAADRLADLGRKHLSPEDNNVALPKGVIVACYEREEN